MPSTDPHAEFVRTFLRANTAGRLTERWYHRAGCGDWFILVRDTRTHESDAFASV